MNRVAGSALAWSLIAAAASPAAAVASDRATVEGPWAVSGHSQFTGACPRMFPVTSQDAAGEPTLAVNPREPNNIALAWTQDNYTQPAVAASTDGGRSFRSVVLQGASTCSGGTDPFALDPWLSFGPDGLAYLVIGADDAVGYPVLSPNGRVLAYRSTDRGSSWEGPTEVEPRDGSFYDKPTVTADPRRPGTAYVVYARRTGPQDLSTGTGYLRATTNSGTSYNARVGTYTPGQFQFPDALLVRALPDGSLLNVFVVGRDNQAPLEMAQRSGDGGRTWSRPELIGEAPTTEVQDPDSGDKVQSDPIPSAAVGPDGTAYVAWSVVDSTHASRVLLSHSTDGGRTWSTPHPVISSSAQAFLPTVAVAADGTVAVTWYDTRNDRSGDAQLTADYWFRHSRDAGRSWQESHLAGPFDLRRAGTVNGHFLGDYFGLAPVPGGFVSAFTQTPPKAQIGPSQIFVARIRLPVAGPTKTRRPRPRTRLTVRPHVVTAGRRTRFYFRITSARRPLAGARITLAGHTTRSDRHGRAGMKLVLPHRGSYRVRATRKGFRTATAAVHARV
jgi:hypothetical protein